MARTLKFKHRKKLTKDELFFLVKEIINVKGKTEAQIDNLISFLTNKV